MAATIVGDWDGALKYGVSVGSQGTWSYSPQGTAYVSMPDTTRMNEVSTTIETQTTLLEKMMASNEQMLAKILKMEARIASLENILATKDGTGVLPLPHDPNDLTAINEFLKKFDLPPLKEKNHDGPQNAYPPKEFGEITLKAKPCIYKGVVYNQIEEVQPEDECTTDERCKRCRLGFTDTAPRATEDMEYCICCYEEMHQ